MYHLPKIAINTTDSNVDSNIDNLLGIMLSGSYALVLKNDFIINIYLVEVLKHHIFMVEDKVRIIMSVTLKNNSQKEDTYS